MSKREMEVRTCDQCGHRAEYDLKPGVMGAPTPFLRWVILHHSQDMGPSVRTVRQDFCDFHCLQEWLRKMHGDDS